MRSENDNVQPYRGSIVTLRPSWSATLMLTAGNVSDVKAAPGTDQCCIREENPCQLGAVHTWHIADNPTVPAFVRFWTKADKGSFLPAMVCPLMTQSGHSAYLLDFGSFDRSSSASCAGSQVIMSLRFPWIGRTQCVVEGRARFFMAVSLCGF